MFCEDGCPRDADHFPWIGYANTWNSCVTGTFTCAGQTGPTGNVLYNSVDALGGSTSYGSVQPNAGNTAFINYLNSASPANYIWFTPTDSHNMHSDSVSTGDNYLASLLCGCGAGGTVSNPNAGTLFSTNLWKLGNTFLYLWWDEYDPSPNVEYGSMIKIGYTSTGGYDKNNSLHTIEANWALPYITSIVSGDSTMSDIYGTSTSPPNPPPSQPPNSQPTNGGTCSLCDIPHLLTTVSFLSITLLVAVFAGVSVMLARYHARNRRLYAMLQDRESD